MKFVFYNKETMEKIEGPIEMSDCQTPEQAINTRYGSGIRDHIGCEMEPTQAEKEQHRRRVRHEIELAMDEGPDPSLEETFGPIDEPGKDGDQDDGQAERRLGDQAESRDRDGQGHDDGQGASQTGDPEVQGGGPGEPEEVRVGDAEVQDRVLGAA